MQRFRLLQLLIKGTNFTLEASLVSVHPTTVCFVFKENRVCFVWNGTEAPLLSIRDGLWAWQFPFLSYLLCFFVTSFVNAALCFTRSFEDYFSFHLLPSPETFLLKTQVIVVSSVLWNEFRARRTGKTTLVRLSSGRLGPLAEAYSKNTWLTFTSWAANDLWHKWNGLPC